MSELPKVDDVFPGFCCKGHDWHVISVTPDDRGPEWSSLWGRCENPDCPDKCGCGLEPCHFDGVSSLAFEDFQERLEELEAGE